MTEIGDIETAVDLLEHRKISIIKINNNMLINYQDCEMELPLNCLFSVGEHGNIIRLSDQRICPMLRSECRGSMCCAFENNHCTIFEGHGNGKIKGVNP